MATGQTPETWEELERLLGSADGDRLAAYLDILGPGEAGRAISRLAEGDRQRLLALLPPPKAAELIGELSQAQAAGLIGSLPPEQAAPIVAQLPSAERADLLAEVDADMAAAILALLPPDVAEETRRLEQYPPDSAGGLMSAEYLAYPETDRVADIIADFRARAATYSRYKVQYAYVVSETGTLIGVLSLRDLLLAPGDAPVHTIMTPVLARLSADAPLDEVARFFDRRPFLGAPVTDDEGRLLGVVSRADAEEAQGDRAERRFLLASGVLGGEEFRSMPWRERLYRRLVWLFISLVLCLVAASVIGAYEDTLAAVIALAVFLPVISGMGGNAGNQAMAVSVRELSLGLIKPHEFRWVLRKEFGVAAVNGFLLGAVLGGLAVAWKGNLYLGLVVGTAAALTMLLAACVGGVVPLILRRLNLDPAIATGPVLMTLTDTCGFFIALSLARLMLHQISP